jgi:hypothetical protein
MMDNWTSAGARLPKQLTAHATYPTPMEEIGFEDLAPETPSIEDFESIEESIRLRDLGLWTQMIPLTEIMTEVKELHEKSVQNRRSPMEI